ncbi:MAG TPA: tetratricopeptide repeat protein [Usitatibacter sp.]|nr:tetratricopeptide repeat protein [Usitatibacter sp.]
MNAPARRNDPCPCGSGLRYKECHGKLDAAGPPGAQRVQRALQLHQAGRIDEAERLYREVLREEPGHAVALHYLGLIAWARGDRAEAERLMRESLAIDAAVPDFHNNLGLLLRDTRRVDEAIAAYRRAIAIEPRWMDAYSNLGLALEAAGRNEEAVAAYEEALAREPRFAIGHQNLALALLKRGAFREAWPHYRWRLLAQGFASMPPDPAAAAWPERLDGRAFAIRTEQGLGDALFFLRFAPEAVRRGARLAFRGDARLHPILDRTGLFALGLAAETAPSPGLEEIFAGDLPWLLGLDHAARLPGPLPLQPDPNRVRDWRVKLAALGAAPCVALTWRAGTTSAGGPARNLFKEVSPALLGQRLRERRATWISVQRLPAPGERESLAEALGAPVHDASYANNDLEEILALISVVDDYVGVSNTNTHLRAGTGGPMRVLVPHPPEWRWGLEGERSVWFPTALVERQHVNGRW